ncbi:MAG: transglycosylase SLT domain-containing protein [Prevotella sp.]|nr:transglycosylase SLT domain-containing protein [Prevotella sp.]
MQKGIYIQVFFLVLLLTACGQKKQDVVVAPWGEITDTIPTDDGFDLNEIQRSGELIALTLTGPETYYDYRGRHLGTQYLLAQRFANKLGVSLRMEVCRDSSEMLSRLEAGEADLCLFPPTSDSLLSKSTPLPSKPDTSCLPSGWLIDKEKSDLKQELLSWYNPRMLTEVKKEEDYFLSSRSVQRHVYAPMLNRQGGVISHYDALFQRHAARIRWDWRLLAAQCYQESTFDPQAKSWAGACGLMQIMPSTADYLGLPRSEIFLPEQNIAAAVRYIAELDQAFSDVQDRMERIRFVLAAYNGGGFHIRDAMALAKKHGRNPYRWREVESFVLGLQRAEYYNDPVVRNGYMRGSETVDYVRRIQERWNGYRGMKNVHAVASGPSGVPQKAKRERKKYQISDN